ncbi:hypothetical protein HMSSN036_82930 [Paenibacillus macerans]|nr:hypothetical protein HMSSN036_82930 [Paenibacillus macerans]
MFTRNKGEDASQVLQKMLAKIPPVYHGMIPSDLSDEEKVAYLEEQEQRGILERSRFLCG